MPYRIKPARQMIEFVSSLPPARPSESKRTLINLGLWQRDILALQGRLAGYYRLRVGSYRYLFAIRPGMQIEVIFAGERAVVYHLFEAHLHAGETKPLT